MNVDALVITSCRPGVPGQQGKGFIYRRCRRRRYRAGVPYSADRLRTSPTSVYGNVNGAVKREFPAFAANRQRTGAQGAGGLAAQPAGDVGGYSAPAGLVGPSRHPGRFFRRQVGAGWPARGQSGAFAGCGGRYRTVAAGPEGRHIYNLCAPRHPARGLFIRRWPASSVCRRRCSATARTAARVRL